MPEGDTIHHAADRIRPVLEGEVPDSIETPHPRFAADRWRQRLAGRGVREVSAHGKHLFLRFDGDLTLHSHLRMTGAWSVCAQGARWRRAPRRAWLVIRAGGCEVVEFDGPVLELMTESRTRWHQRLTQLGPDILAPRLDEESFLARLRAGDPSRRFGDALLDQRTIAGIGNIWKAEACWDAGVSPWRRASDIDDEDALSVIRRVRPRMQASARRGMIGRDRRVYGRPGRPCPRCATPLRAHGQGDANRTTYWCPGCQT